MSDEITVSITRDELEQLLNGEAESVSVRETMKAPNTTPIAEAEMGSEYDLMGVVRTVDDINTFDRDSGGQGQVRNIRIQDRTGDIRVALWGEHANLDLSTGDYVHLLNASVEDGYQDTREASVGYDSSIYVVEEPEEEDTYVTIELDQ